MKRRSNNNNKHNKSHHETDFDIAHCFVFCFQFHSRFSVSYFHWLVLAFHVRPKLERDALEKSLLLLWLLLLLLLPKWRPFSLKTNPPPLAIQKKKRKEHAIETHRKILAIRSTRWAADSNNNNEIKLR